MTDTTDWTAVTDFINDSIVALESFRIAVTNPTTKETLTVTLSTDRIRDFMSRLPMYDAVVTRETSVTDEVKDILPSEIHPRWEDIELIRFRSRSEAERILVGLSTALKSYGVVTVGDYLHLITQPHFFQDHQWGWTELSATVERTFERRGDYDVDSSTMYRLVLPPPVRLTT
jgi:hypothetical protein